MSGGRGYLVVENDFSGLAEKRMAGRGRGAGAYGIQSRTERAMAQVISNQSIEEEYCERTRGSAALARQARDVFPSGVTHDSRYLEPHGIYVTHAAGARKWDVDGNELIDYFGGHGALLLGHAHPEVTRAVALALQAGTHFGAGHEAEIGWGSLVKRLIPCAQRVRFTSSGTEATHMAIRLARTHTGKSRFIRFQGHFHGWHDEVVAGYQSHFDGSAPIGIPADLASKAITLVAGDVDAVAAVLDRDADVAGVILEPIGAGTGTVPLRASFVEALRELSTERGVILIFDEVVTGFRVTRGGAQAYFGVTPDLCSLAKILAGGLPGGAVAGRAELLDPLDFAATSGRNKEKFYHPGTFNANPVCAAAGRTALGIIDATDACEQATRQAEKLRRRLTDVLVDLGIGWGVYGESSDFHLFLNPARRPLNPREFDPFEPAADELKSAPKELSRALRLAMLIHGVDLSPWPGGLTSIAHDDEVVEQTALAFERSLARLRREALV